MCCQIFFYQDLLRRLDMLDLVCQVFCYQDLLHRLAILGFLFCLAGLSSYFHGFITECIMDCIYLDCIMDYIVDCICLVASDCCHQDYITDYLMDCIYSYCIMDYILDRIMCCIILAGISSCFEDQHIYY